jgi:hypothetical protein
MEKELRTGRKVVMRESNGLDEMLSYQVLGDNFDENNLFGANMLQRSIVIALCIETVDGEPVDHPTTLEELYEFLKQFKSTEWNDIQSLYREVNAVNLK